MRTGQVVKTHKKRIREKLRKGKIRLAIVCRNADYVYFKYACNYMSREICNICYNHPYTTYYDN